jgi:hypothetical protein
MVFTDRSIYESMKWICANCDFSRYHEILTGGYEILTRGQEIIKRGNEMLTRGHEILAAKSWPGNINSWCRYDRPFHMREKG